MPKVLVPAGIQSRKRFGQHFLVRRSILEAIVQRAGLEAETTVVEIGAGTGNLTRALARRAGKVYALEFDRELAAGLREELPGGKVEVIQADVLEFDFASLKPDRGAFKIVGNLPFNISVPLIFRLLENPGLCPELLLMVQREVAERITARPNEKSYGVLAVLCQMRAEVEIVLSVPPSAFRPAPKVHSAVVRFRLLEGLRYPVPEWGFFKQVVKAALGQRRKIIANALKNSPGLGLPAETILSALAQAGIAPTRRGQSLTLLEFSELSRSLKIGASQKIQTPV